MKNSTELRGHTGGLECVAWNPTKEAELASVSSDGTCRFWDVRNKTCTAIVQLGGEGLTAGWSGDGEVMIAGRKVLLTSFCATFLNMTLHSKAKKRPLRSEQ